MNCPKCNASITQVGKYWICPEHGQIELKLEIPYLNIFLSYGHDNNEELVLKIKKDLEIRGHDVWIDKSEIKAGDDWRRSITDGVLKSNKVISFLSRHSTREPGVCRDEIVIAVGVKGGNVQTVLIEDEKEVDLPNTISHIQWLDMSEWRKKKLENEKTWGEWYLSKFKDICFVLESEESQRFAGEITDLADILKPISSENRISQLLSRGFVGREWLFQEIKNWSEDINKKSPLFWIVGGPGVGKSSFAAQLAHLSKAKIIGAQFCEWDKPDHREPKRVIMSIAFQIATRLPDYRKLLLKLPEIRKLDDKTSTELFDYLLVNPLNLSIDGGRERYLIVIDALDEAGDSFKNSFAEVISNNIERLPRWIGFVVTSRPDSSIISSFQKYNPNFINTETESNLSDIKSYLRTRLKNYLKEIPNEEEIISQIINNSEGTFLYISRFCEEVENGIISISQPNNFPKGLGGTYYQWFQRQFPNIEEYREKIRPVLRVIVSARESLAIDFIKDMFNWKEEEFHDFLKIFGSLIQKSIFTTNSEICFKTPLNKILNNTRLEILKPFHQSIIQWLVSNQNAGLFYVSSSEGHRSFSDFLFKNIVNFEKNERYSLSFIHSHLIEINNIDKLKQILNCKFYWQNSPTFYQDNFYFQLSKIFDTDELLSIMQPIHNYFKDEALRKKPTNLGYTLFPHEPGVNFTDGIKMDGYMIPKGIKEPPTEVLWDFIAICHRILKSSLSFKNGTKNLKVSTWYIEYWENSALIKELDTIERYYDSHLQHLSFRAMEVSWKIEESIKK